MLEAKKVRVRHIPLNPDGRDRNGIYYGNSGFKDVWALDPDWGYSRIVFAGQPYEVLQMVRRIWKRAEVIWVKS